MSKKGKDKKKASYSISGMAEIKEEKRGINLENEGTKFFVILLCIVAFVALLYLVDALRNNKEEEEPTETTVTINYNEVLVGNMLDQKYDKYFVYAYNKDEENSSSIEASLPKVGNYYKLNLDKINNSPALGEKSNFKGTIDQIKFKGTTLLMIEKGKITKSYEGSEAIIKYLESIKG